MADLVKTIEDDEIPEDLSEESASEDEFQPTRKRAKTGDAKSGGLDPTFEFGQFTQDIWADKWVQAVKKKRKITSTLDEKIKKRVGLGGGGTHVEEEMDIKEEDASSSDDDDKESEEQEESDEIESDNSSIPKKKLKKSIKKNLVVDEDDDDDILLSDDELQEDKIVVKDKNANKKGKKKGKTQQADDDNDDEVQRQEVRLEDDPDYVFETNMSFQQMNLSRPLLKAITSLGFVHPTPIQAAAIPIALGGRDICGCAATGTGKTAAYMLPVLERLLYKPKIESMTRVLCLVPTRELGVQVYQVTKNLASFSNDIEIGLAVGGLDIQQQESVLRQNPDVVIATPGRLIDHLGNTPSFNLASIEILILDEADRMLDEWFAVQLKEIVKQCSPRRQTLLFSATMTDKVKDLASVSLKNPCKIFVDSNKQVAFNLRQQFVKIRNETDREAILCALIVRTFHNKTMVFVPTKKIAHRLHIVLGLMGIRIGELHGDLIQSARLEALKKFQSGEVDVLMVTDVAARGLDIPGVQSVLNYTMPPTLEQYIHRCGRTARAGRSGVAVSLVGENDRKLMKQVAKSATLPVKARIIPPEIIAKYRDRLKPLETEIESIMQEEEAEKTLVRAEIEANKAIKMIQDKKTKKKKKRGGGPPEPESKSRVWFQTHKDRKDDHEKLQGRNPAKLRKAIATAQEDMQIRKLVDFQKRQAKGKKKGRKPKSFDDNSGTNGFGPKKAKKKSYFDEEITDVKNARAFRHQPKSFKNDGNNKGRGGGGKEDNKPPKKGGTPRSNVNKSDRKFSQKMKNKAR